MRRYLQGTLDYACGIYAVINAVACVHDLRLPEARKIFNATMEDFATRPAPWAAFIRNRTDHYWVIRYMLRRWCLREPCGLEISRPGGFAAPISDADLEPGGDTVYLPERCPPRGPKNPGDQPGALSDTARREVEAVRRALRDALKGGTASGKAVLVRFHRFLPDSGAVPLVSHWTSIRSADAGTLYLHDASAEKKAVHAVKFDDLLPEKGMPALRIVPESLYMITLPSSAVFLETH
ncbi:MAG: hypothetical protein LBQ51_01015 [Desulfovibrio sp.]|jgi:hypothetical protein|nr:hypothetical protein [Desulfovibrio sp.]